VAGLLVAGQLAMDLRLEYPNAPLPMTLLARRLYDEQVALGALVLGYFILLPPLMATTIFRSFSK
jgi:hypothetical protein